MTDLIDRQTAIEEFEKELSAKYNRRELAIGFVGIKSILEKLPSAQPENRAGKWVKNEEESANHSEPIYRCSACLNWEAWGNYECTSFCPHCGAKMEVENEDNDAEQ